MSIATQMQRFKDIGDAIRNAIHTRNNEVEVDDLKFDDFADIISTLNNINTDTYTVPGDSLLLTYDFGEYNKIRKVDIADFYQAVYDRAESSGVQKCWSATTVVCGMSSDAWSGNKKVVRATATCSNTLGMTSKTSSTSVSVDATSVYNNGYNAGRTMASGKFISSGSTGGLSTINLGWQPSNIAVAYADSAKGFVIMYSATLNSTFWVQNRSGTGSSANATGATTTYLTPTSTGFTFKIPSYSQFSSHEFRYIAFK